jgi:nucleotide-binding universal stress UspA family protein
VISVLVFVLVWLVLGAVVGVVLARRGHSKRIWLLTTVLGPIALPLATLLWGDTRWVGRPQLLSPGVPGEGAIDVLVGIDGSPAARAAAELALDMLGAQVGRFMLAAVRDYDTATAPGELLNAEPWADEHRAEGWLAEIADDLATSRGVRPATVLLAGDPAEALRTYASEGGYELLVAGRRGRGLSKLLLGSCAAHLAASDGVPVLLAPDGQRVDRHHRARRASA